MERRKRQLERSSVGMSSQESSRPPSPAQEAAATSLLGTGTFQAGRPGAKWRPGMSTGTVSKAPSDSASAAPTTASHSTGFSAHVEYASNPPGAKSSMPLRRMQSWSPWCAMPARGVQVPSMEGALRTVPSPLQGTSQSTRSKRTAAFLPALAAHAMPGKERASLQKATNGSAGTLLTRSINSCRRASLRSFTTSNPGETVLASAASASSNCIVLEPGAAQSSRTLCCGSTCSACTGNIDAVS
mmetsp:Transcript_118217/g.346310  ORF Transcript_118217/g.346310 Transcript_118217/m.346310 type:complete len:243 (+) Transcript_118217:1138-1866(+)